MIQQSISLFPKENLLVVSSRIEANPVISGSIELRFFGYLICRDIHPIISLITLFLLLNRNLIKFVFITAVLILKSFKLTYQIGLTNFPEHLVYRPTVSIFQHPKSIISSILHFEHPSKKSIIPYLSANFTFLQVDCHNIVSIIVPDFHLLIWTSVTHSIP